MFRYLAACTLIAATVPACAGPVRPGVRSIVLVNGAFADGSGWRRVYDILRRDGYRVSIVQEPLTGLEADIAATRRELARQDGNVVLVGHSYGGAVITAAGEDPKVKALVYVAAFQPDKGETIEHLVKSRPAPNDDGVQLDGFITLRADRFAADFAADVPVADAAFMAHSQRPIAAAAFAAVAPAAAWRSRRSYAILTTQDHALNPELQQYMYGRSDAKVTRIASSHAVFLSHPREVAEVVERAAREAGR